MNYWIIPLLGELCLIWLYCDAIDSFTEGDHPWFRGGQDKELVSICAGFLLLGGIGLVGFIPALLFYFATRPIAQAMSR